MTCTMTLFFLIALCFISAHAARFDITNRCSYPLWAAAVPGGGSMLNSGQSWALDVAAGTKGARIWARTGCSFHGSGHGGCQTGDCGGVLECTAYGAPPNTLAEYGLNQYNNLDFFDISLVDGFNTLTDSVPLSSRPKGVATTLALSSKPTSTVAILEAVLQLPCRNSSRIGAPMLKVIPKMMQPTPSPAMVALTIGLSFALD
ncbi:unnamed protein product [Sphenostylis stenocarpa]|uniref:Thaumatin-like protein n=1 Tax=Sphenostylis stenocarpa TaxID=92480 RepID=A0AA86SQF6_9FABA|nr:unnamed protein product [Sphenostylis stenocarpa]